MFVMQRGVAPYYSNQYSNQDCAAAPFVPFTTPEGRASSRNKRPYGAPEAQAFLDKVLPSAPLVKRLRQIGMGRVLYGTDSAQGENLRPREVWAAFRKLPLTDAEFKQVAGNLAPYFR